MGVLLSPVGVVGGYGSVDCSFKYRERRALVIIPLSAYGPKVQRVIPPGIGGAEAEAPVVI